MTAPGSQGDDVDVHVVAQVGGVDEPGGAPAIVGVGHPADRLVLLVGDEGGRRLDAVDRLVALPHPVEADGRRPAVEQRPGAAGRQESVAAGLQQVRLAVDGDGRLALDHEQHALGAGIGLRPVAAAAGEHFHDVLRERLGKPGHRPGDHPGARVLPVGQVAGDDVPHDPVRNDRVGLGEDGAAGVQGGLIGEASHRAGVGSVDHETSAVVVDELY